MSAFQRAEALATQRYDRDKLLALVDEVTTHFRMPNSFERSKMRAVCKYLADASEHLNNNTPVHVIQALLASPDTVMIYAKLYPSQLEEYRKTVRSLYNAYYGE